MSNVYENGYLQSFLYEIFFWQKISKTREFSFSDILNPYLNFVQSLELLYFQLFLIVIATLT